MDRNTLAEAWAFLIYASLSARRAWIEIVLGYKDTVNALSRSPQGERG